MRNPRFHGVEIAGQRTAKNGVSKPQVSSSEVFGKRVFNRSVIKKMLPKEICQNILNAMEGREKIGEEFADTIALAMKEWAVGLGATHYCHWFQPLTGASAEKHDSFIDWNGPGEIIEKFSGKQLIQGEPDASSFPSGGLRSTYEARGYTGWDPTSPVFLWKAGDGVTLCIPSVFFSWTGAVLDTKIPLLRSDNKMNDAAMRLLKLTGIPSNYITCTLGLEQEYFVIDRALRQLRPDLVMLGRTVYGSPAPKGQELQDHYFGAVKDRILSYMQDFEGAALELGIPVKTRHNEVAPAQHEVAPVYEKSSTAVDHNILLMELMRQIAVRHELACLLHEKPFKGVNGSGKHCNWSLATDTGINLLDPSETPGNNLHFLILLTAILHAIHEHSTLLRASIGSASNDYRLGGHEAPPAIISVYLGEELERILENIEQKGSHADSSIKGKFNLGVAVMPDLTKDNTDRNRTSPFAFTGNKFEFRAVGSSSNPAFPVTVLNVIVADSLNQMIDEIERELEKKGTHKKTLIEASMSTVRKYLKNSHPIRFSGDNYTKEWASEAKKRSLPNIKKSIEAFEALKSPKTIKIFQGILTEEELKSRLEILLDIYCSQMNIEANLLIDMFNTQILPCLIKYQKEISKSLIVYQEAIGKGHSPKEQLSLLTELTKKIEEAIKTCRELETIQKKACKMASLEEKAKVYCHQAALKGEELREIVDFLEGIVDDSLWPLAKYRELLFII